MKLMATYILLPIAAARVFIFFFAYDFHYLQSILFISIEQLFIRQLPNTQTEQHINARRQEEEEV